MTYQKAFNLQGMHKFGMFIYKKGIVIDVVPEYLRGVNVDDFKGIIKTVNQHFLQDEYPFIGMEIYVDLEYIYSNKDMRNTFTKALKRVSFE
jgi:hypothetical protein